MKSAVKRLVPLLIALLLALPVELPGPLSARSAALAASGEEKLSKKEKRNKGKLTVQGYRLLDANDLSLTEMKKGDSADIELLLASETLRTDKIPGADAIKIEKLSDAFVYGDPLNAAPTLELLSEGKAPLQLRIRFHRLLREGGGKYLKFRVSYVNTDLKSRTLKVKMAEFVKTQSGGEEAKRGAAAEGAGAESLVSKPRVDKCRVLMDGKARKKLSPGQSADIEITFKNKGLTRENLGASGLTVTKLEDSFSSAGVPARAEILSGAGKALKAKFIFPSLSYLGGDNDLRFRVDYGTEELPAEIIRVKLRQADKGKKKKNETISGETLVKDGASAIPIAAETPTVSAAPAAVAAAGLPVPAQPSGEGGDTPAPPAPLVRITRSDMAPISAGGGFTLDLTIKNLGTADLQDAILAFSPSDSLMLLENTASLELGRIAAGQSASAKIRMRALDEIQSPSQGLNAELKFSYDGGEGLQSASSAETVFVPVNLGAKEIEAPKIIISRVPLPDPVKANEEFTLTLHVKNLGGKAVESGVAALTSSENLMLLEDSSSVPLGRIEPDAQLQFNVRLKALKQIAAQLQSLTVEYKYDYLKGRTLEHETASERVLIPAKVTKQKSGGGGSAKVSVDSPTPNVIVSEYTAGAEQVAAGSEFPLKLSFKNTSPGMTIENIVMTLETGESFTITDASNTFYYPELGPGQTQSETVRMQAIPGAKPGPGKMDVSFKYEYVDNKKRSSATIAEKLSIPVFQPDRFQMSAPTLPETIPMGEELVLSFPYVNKGKSEVSNLEATLEGEVPALSKFQNLGNLEPGKSGTIDFILTPDAPGAQDVLVKISYEDANQTVVKKEFPLKLPVEDPMAGMEEGGIGEGEMGEYPEDGYEGISSSASTTARRAERASVWPWPTR